MDSVYIWLIVFSIISFIGLFGFYTFIFIKRSKVKEKLNKLLDESQTFPIDEFKTMYCDMKKYKICIQNSDKSGIYIFCNLTNGKNYVG